MVVMDDEFYNIDVSFDVVETQRNMERPAIYLSAEVTSFKLKPLSFHRMGHLEYKSVLGMSLKEIFCYIPFSSFIINCDRKQTIRI